MHIPEGYLSPSTCLTLTGAMLPVWYRASAKARAGIDAARVPFLAMGAVFSFLIMMFNIPIPDGTTAHAAGGVLLAIVLGPWAAVIAVSVALLIQALLFGDGGVLSFGANALNLAFIMPFTGYYTYRLAAGHAPAGSARRLFAAGLGGYVGLNVAALAAAVQFGLQPLLFTAADGTPLYCPYGLEVTIPAMLLPHLTLAGFAEAAVTALALKYVLKTSPEMLAAGQPGR
ncbi:cobalt transporter CbiM [Anaeroselena agilis]|uniref:Cobalt transporter CbiM n=1 Tax=Anaeroselena agilis TaxID=3063788 RepID=A0ABU3P1R2_9FIRM|nr:cobalt transporter CbiM [Selenomonadales bacterium 4137-cl]